PFVNGRDRLRYRASGDVKAKAHISRDQQTLNAHGILFDDVFNKLEPYPHRLAVSQYLDVLKVYFESNLLSRRPNSTDTRHLLDRSESHWRTMIADMSPAEDYLHDPFHFRLEANIIPAHPSCGTMYEVLLNNKPVPRDFTPPSPMPAGPPNSLSEIYTEPFW